MNTSSIPSMHSKCLGYTPAPGYNVDGVWIGRMLKTAVLDAIYAYAETLSSYDRNRGTGSYARAEGLREIEEYMLFCIDNIYEVK